jgi:hypothetical protein
LIEIEAVALVPLLAGGQSHRNDFILATRST